MQIAINGLFVINSRQILQHILLLIWEQLPNYKSQ